MCSNSGLCAFQHQCAEPQIRFIKVHRILSDYSTSFPAMSAPTPAAEYLQSRISSASSQSEQDALSEIGALYERKLWHQLTEKVHTLVQTAPFSNMRDFYTSFLKTFEASLNPVTLMHIISAIVRKEIDENPKDALAFLLPLLEDDEDKKASVFTNSKQAHVLLLSHIAYLQMKDGDNASSKKTFEKAGELVNSATMSAPVYSVYYRAAAEYHKVVGTAFDFFQNALQFLAYTPPESVPLDEQRQWAFDIGIAALVGAEIYNFGEVLNHSVISSLVETEHAWLWQLLQAFRNGDLPVFDQVCATASEKMNAQPVLVAHEEFLKQKITILALLSLTYTKSFGGEVTFAEVEKKCRLPSKEVEYLLMRSMSLGLISGTIDNVDEKFIITRVAPRVLEKQVVAEIADDFAKWCQKVDKTLEFVNTASAGIAD